MLMNDFTRKIQIGEAFRMQEDYFRVVGFDESSMCYRGEYAVVYVTSPYGTKVRTGRAFLERVTSMEELNQLYAYENMVKPLRHLYGNELDKIHFANIDKQNVPEFNGLIENIEQEFAPIPGWFPLEIQLEITYDCTLRCTMCYNGVRALNLQFEENLRACEKLQMTPEQEAKFYKLVSACLENGAKFFTITGGEPLLYPDLVCNLIRMIKENGGYASINTNSTLITDTVARQLKEAGLNSALTSIHGSTAEIHRKIVCTPEVFDRALLGIKNLLNNEVYVVPNFVASHANIDDMIQTSEMLYSLGIKRQAFSIFIPTPNVEHHKKLTMTKEDYEKYFHALQYLNDTYPDLSATATLPVPPCLAKGIVDDKVLAKFEHRTCPSGRQFMVVNIDGNVSPCIQKAFDAKYGENLLENPHNIVAKMKDWKNIWNTPEKCIDCAAKSYCNPCNMNILVNNSNLGFSSVPYPDFQPLTEAEDFAKKFRLEIPVDDQDMKRSYQLTDDTVFREESNGYLTMIKPGIQGYAVLSNIKMHSLKGTFRFVNKALYRLFKAMNVLEESSANEYTIIDGSTAPKYKILTEFIGKDFTDEEAVYSLRTDTAGRFFCLANTPEEQAVYDSAIKVYKRQLK